MTIIPAEGDARTLNADAQTLTVADLPPAQWITWRVTVVDLNGHESASESLDFAGYLVQAPAGEQLSVLAAEVVVTSPGSGGVAVPLASDQGVRAELSGGRIDPRRLPGGAMRAQVIGANDRLRIAVAGVLQFHAPAISLRLALDIAPGLVQRGGGQRAARGPDPRAGADRRGAEARAGARTRAGVRCGARARTARGCRR